MPRIVTQTLGLCAVHEGGVQPSLQEESIYEHR